jgi:hypothetical protein
MQRLFAIAKLTWKAAFRFRLFWVMAGLLLLCVIGLPLLVKDDGTARGFTQILLTYTLSMITTLLGFSTLWLACGTLARDIEEAQMQMVAVKPIARWQIWLGKWLGLVALNAALLVVAGGSVFFLLKWRASRLPEAQQRVLRNEVFVARGSLKEAPRDIDAITEVEFQEALKKTQVPPEEQQKVRTQLRERVMAQEQVVPPGYMRVWTIDLGLRKLRLRDEPLFVRTKFYAAQTNASGTYVGVWQIGPPDKYPAFSLSMAGDSFLEFPVSANRLDESGKLIIRFVNQNDSALLFPLDEGLEVLYRDGGFGLNFIRGMVIILCWLALLSAIGLSAASFLSFPVAAFFAATLLVIGLSSGTLSSVVAEGTLGGIDHESGTGNVTLVDRIVMPVFSKLLVVVNLVQGFSPVDSLSTGRSITWGQLGLAFSQIVLLLGGIFATIGIATFTRRELATAQTGS